MDTHLKAAEYTVATIPHKWAARMIRRLHYAKGCSNTGVYVHGLFRKGSYDLLGCALWIPPTKDCAIATYPQGDWQKVLSLSRLVIEEGMPTNSASFLIGRSIRLIEQDGNWECLVTYADKWREHTGAIYRATNWTYAGQTKPQPCWIVDGRMVAKKAGPKTRTTGEMAALGAEMIGSYAKEKFIKLLRARKKKAVPVVEAELFPSVAENTICK
jgi:hypothetical protein